MNKPIAGTLLLNTPGLFPTLFRFLLVIWLMAGLFIPFFTTSVHAEPDADKAHYVASIMEQMSVKELLGQTLMLGYHAELNEDLTERSNEGLRRLIEEFLIGNVILYKYNLPVVRENGIVNESETRRAIWNLTNSLQEAAYRAQPSDRKIPLIIATDQEGGARMQVRHGVTRTPDAMYIGSTRSPDYAKQAGSIIGSELIRLGINTVLAPVADINNNDKRDVVGKRSFAANKRIVAPMSACFMKGLQDSGVLSIAKHYPGHGDAEEDPHIELPSVKSVSAAQLNNWDLYPFQKLIEANVNGLMTAHLLTPLDDVPITYSAKVINQIRTDKPRFDGLVITDDIADMIGILKHLGAEPITKEERDREYSDRRYDVIRRSYEAGTDVIMLAWIRRVDSERLPERTLSLEEFRELHRRLLRYFEQPGKRAILEQAVRRILNQKDHLVPIAKFKDRLAWQRLLDENEFRRLRADNTKAAEDIAKAAIIQITDHGRGVNTESDSTLFSQDEGPLSKGRLLKTGQDRLLVVSPVFWEDTLTKALRNHRDRWFSMQSVETELLVYGWKKRALDAASEHWQRTVKLFSELDDNKNEIFHRENILERAKELVDSARKMHVKAVLFGIVTEAQIKILQSFLEDVTDIPVVVLLFKEPYFMPASIFERPNVSVLFAPAFPDESLAVDALFGRIRPKTINYLPFNIPGRFDVRVLDQVLLTPATDCVLKNFKDYYEEAERLFREGIFLKEQNRQGVALDSLKKAKSNAEQAYNSAENNEEKMKAEELYRNIDRLLLQVLPEPPI